MLRRPWERTRILTAGLDVAVGFAGEWGGVAHDDLCGCLLAFEGELYGPVRTGDAVAAELLRLYLQQTAAFDPPDGSYAIAIWDPRSQRLLLLTDRFATRPLFVNDVDPKRRVLLAAGEVKAVLAMGHRRELDRDTWAQILAYEHPLPGHSPIAGTRRLGGARTLSWRRGEVAEKRRWQLRFEPARAERQELDVLGPLLLRATERRLTATTVLGLSGGLDSRSVAAVLAKAGRRPVTATYGAAGSADLAVATKIAARLDLVQHRLLLPSGYIGRWGPLVAWLSEARLRCFHAHYLSLGVLRYEQGADALLLAALGDHVMRGVEPPSPESADTFPEDAHSKSAICLTDRRFDQVLLPDLADSLRDRAATGMRAALESEEGSAHERWWQLNAAWRTTDTGSFYADLIARDPFTDPELVEFCRRLSLTSRLNGSLQRAFLTSRTTLGDLPSPKQGTAPSSRAAEQLVQSLLVRARQQAARCSPSPLRRRFGVAGHGASDYSLDLRSASRPLLSILVEERTLDRRQIRPDAAQAIVDEIVSGRTTNTRLAGTLVTLELFQRYFIDDDPPQAGDAETDEVTEAPAAPLLVETQA